MVNAIHYFDSESSGQIDQFFFLLFNKIIKSLYLPYTQHQTLILQRRTEVLGVLPNRMQLSKWPI